MFRSRRRVYGICGFSIFASGELNCSRPWTCIAGGKSHFGHLISWFSFNAQNLGNNPTAETKLLHLNGSRNWNDAIEELALLLKRTFPIFSSKT